MIQAIWIWVNQNWCSNLAKTSGSPQPLYKSERTDQVLGFLHIFRSTRAPPNSRSRGNALLFVSEDTAAGEAYGMSRTPLHRLHVALT